MVCWKLKKGFLRQSKPFCRASIPRSWTSLLLRSMCCSTRFDPGRVVAILSWMPQSEVHSLTNQNHSLKMAPGTSCKPSFTIYQIIKQSLWGALPSIQRLSSRSTVQLQHCWLTWLTLIRIQPWCTISRVSFLGCSPCSLGIIVKPDDKKELKKRSMKHSSSKTQDRPVHHYPVILAEAWKQKYTLDQLTVQLLQRVGKVFLLKAFSQLQDGQDKTKIFFKTNVQLKVSLTLQGHEWPRIPC